MKSNTKKQAPLPFPQWIEKTYPKKTAARSFLQMIGALDLAYLMYRAKSTKKTEKNPSAEKIGLIKKQAQVSRPAVTAPISKKAPIKKSPKPKVIAPVPEIKKEELIIEFEHKPEPIKKKIVEPVPEIAIEPEPLVLQEEPVIEKPKVEKPVKKTTAKSMWLNDESLEDADLRKATLVKNGVTVAFETLYGDDEEETTIVVNGVSWRALLTSPALNLSKMVQVLRVSYGEVYVLGRMALGAMSGEGYVSSDEAERIIQTLAVTQSKTIDLDVAYHDKDGTSKKRTAHVIRIRFERI